jgi:hypothetical protein
MKIIIIGLSTFLFFISCEDKDDAEGTNSLVGTWEMTNSGEYANADCSGTIDYSEWAFMSAFGVKATLKFTSDGKGTFTVSAFGETQDTPMTWDESKSQICLMGAECLTYKLNDNKFTIDAPNEEYCEDDNGEDTSQTDQSSCEAAGNTWFPKTCQIQEFTKK